MGGFGSGRWGDPRPTVEQMRRLDIARLRSDLLSSGVVSVVSWNRRGESIASVEIIAVENGLRLIYRTRRDEESWSDIDEVIRFSWTRTRFGGRRRWLTCPGCSKRCRALFGGSRFRCRHCHGLRYSSQRETRIDRANRAMMKIVKKLDLTAQGNELPHRPRGMHSRTYEGLAERYDEYDAQWSLEVMRRFRQFRDY